MLISMSSINFKDGVFPDRKCPPLALHRAMFLTSHHIVAHIGTCFRRLAMLSSVADRPAAATSSNPLVSERFAQPMHAQPLVTCCVLHPHHCPKLLFLLRMRCIMRAAAGLTDPTSPPTAAAPPVAA
jgi:hypothetical protein